MDRPTRHGTFIPVAVDAVRPIEGAEMVRVVYLTLTTDAPVAVWEVELPPPARLHGVGALGIAGVVYSARRQTGRAGLESVEFDLFTGAEDVAAIFTLEEADPPITVQIEDVWMPSSWFRGVAVWGVEGSTEPGSELERGRVYRVALPLFQDAYRYTAGDLDLDQLLLIRPDGQVVSSPMETAALRDWSQDQIDTSRAAFPDKELKLRYRGQTVA